jgi:hypothetical protein
MIGTRLQILAKALGDLLRRPVGYHGVDEPTVQVFGLDPAV